MALLHGKQIRDDSVLLAKLDDAGSQGAILFGSGTMIGITDAPVNATDLVNKAYADSLATGLDFKDSVKAATTADISLSGEQTIDGVSVVDGDRVLVKNQSQAFQNGIYIVEAGVGAWDRADDADSNEKVTAGLFCFVEEGTLNGDKGFVLTTNDDIVLGTTNLTFAQFTAAGSYVEGNGIDISGQTISVDLASGSGLTLSGAGLSVASSIAGDGLSFAGGILSVDDIDLTSDTTGVLPLENGGTGASIDGNGILNGELLIGSNIGDGFIQGQLTPGNAIGITNGAGSITIAVEANSIEIDEMNISGTQATNKVIGWDGSGFAWVVSSDTDNQQISGTDNGDGTFTVNLTGDTPSSKTFNVANFLDDLSINTFGDVTISSPTANQVLAYNGSAWVDTALSAAIISFDDSGLSISASDVQAALEELDAALSSVDTASLIQAGADRGQACQVTSSDEDWTGAEISNAPIGHVIVFVNGHEQTMEYDKSSGDCYFSGDSGTTAKTAGNIAASDRLYWIGSNAGFQLDGNDVIDLIYET